MHSQLLCPHCGLRGDLPDDVEARQLREPLPTLDPKVTYVPESALAATERIEMYEFVGWITGDHFDRCWARRATDAHGALLALLPSSQIDWRGGYRHAPSEAMLERAIKLGAARLLSSRRLSLPDAA